MTPRPISNVSRRSLRFKPSRSSAVCVLDTTKPYILNVKLYVHAPRGVKSRDYDASGYLVPRTNSSEKVSMRAKGVFIISSALHRVGSHTITLCLPDIRHTFTSGDIHSEDVGASLVQRSGTTLPHSKKMSTRRRSCGPIVSHQCRLHSFVHATILEWSLRTVLLPRSSGWELGSAGTKSFKPQVPLSLPLIPETSLSYRVVSIVYAGTESGDDIDIGGNADRPAKMPSESVDLASDLWNDHFNLR